jgi:molecular chaperone DnaK
MPQIEVTFDIDANGILHVHARDKATGKENKITIKASSGLTEDEIQRMVRDAEAHAAEDRKLMEAVQARNSLDALVHSVQKSVSEYGDKVGADEKGRIEAAIKDAETLLKDNNASKDALEAKTESLAKSAQKLGEIMYAQSQQEASAGASQGAGPGASSAGGGGGAQSDEKVVDAEFTEVKDRK